MAGNEETVRPIVVGTDLAPAALAAADWAAERAIALGAPLALVMVAPGVPIPARKQVYQAMRSPDYLREVKARIVRHLEVEAARVREAHPSLTVETLTPEGDPAGVLVELSRTARFTVIGTHGRPSLTDRLLGGTAEGIISNALGTVVAVPPGTYDKEGPVVVGVDDPEASETVLRIAHTEATLAHRRLVAVHAWHEVVVSSPFDVPVVLSDPDVVTKEVRRLLAGTLSKYAEQFPEVTSTSEVVEGHPADVLVERSKHASALIVGARGLGGFLGLLLGSTSRFVVRHSHCPVVVVRHQRT